MTHQQQHTTSQSGSRAPVPAAGRTPRELLLHGDRRIDDYYWLRDRENPAVTGYIEAENRYTGAVMEDTSALQESLYRELVGRIRETDVSAPVKRGGYYYYYLTEEGKSYPVYCRKKESLLAGEEVLLDMNSLAEGRSFCALGAYEPSPDHSKLLYSVDFSGNETYTICVKDLERGVLLPDELEATAGNCQWGGDGGSFYYTVHDDAHRPFRLYRHFLGTPRADDELLYEEGEKAFNLFISRSRSGRFLLLDIAANDTSETRYIDFLQPGKAPALLAPRRKGIEYFAEHWEDRFFIRTNDNAKNFRVMEAPLDAPPGEHWKEFIAHREDVLVEDLDAFKGHLVVYERKAGLRLIRIISMENHEEHYIDFPEPVYTFRPEGNREYGSQSLRFTYESMVTPESTCLYGMNTRELQVLKQKEVKGYDKSLYASERINAVSHDGTLVPLSLVYRKDSRREGGNPLYLLGYGSYGICLEPVFSPNRLTLLDRGFIFAIAHIRGGEDLGRPWYEEGKLLRKKNTFLDFIACAEHLVKERYTVKESLVISGRSAGGLLMGAVMAMRPDLCHAMVTYVPFVDVLTTMLDETIPLTTIEYAEWGNPKEREYYEYMKSYSPYDNLKPAEYPHVLVFTGLHDTRVMYWEPLKFVAKLRTLKEDDHLLLIKIDCTSGHGGASGRYDLLREIAFEFAFLFKVMAIPA
ncbi:MAG: S9 family peptidase [Candidatus Eremiobacteraeota bacterium]|nr:S9 family peptidase [Candidatus Eremiobacteraeota bacterium]